MKNVLVTGGAGFLGSNLIDHIFQTERHVKIWCIDNLQTGSEKNIVHLLERTDFVYIKHDVCDPIDLDVRFDEVYNLACPASPVHYQSDPIKTIKTCFIGTSNILDLVRKCNAKLLHASTSEIYGDPKVHPQDEDYWGNVNPIGIRSCYDEGKRAAETLIFDYKRMFNVKVRVVRIFNTYGPRMSRSDGRVVSNFINQALRNQDITIYGDGLQTRSFCFVSDLIEVIYRFMQNNSEVSGPINIGNPNEFTIKELAENVVEKTCSSSKIIFEKLPEDDPKQRRPNINKAQKLLLWTPKVQLSEGLQKTIDFFEDPSNG